MDHNPNSGRERFQLLLQQLGLTDDAFVNFFIGAEIDKLSIERESKTWHFSFKLPALIPCSVHTRLATHLASAFAHIAQVSFTLNVENPQVTPELVKEYWKNCIGELEGISPALLSLLHEQEPQVNGFKIVVNARNSAEAGQLKRKYSGLISNIYQNFGFPPMTLEAEVNEAVSNTDYKKFLEEKHWPRLLSCRRKKRIK